MEYDPKRISLEAILYAYFYVIDPTVKNRQGNDVGPQYQTGIYYSDENSKEGIVRETYEETGINIKIIGPSFKDDKYEPIAVERYINKVGDMIDIQYLAIPIEITLNNNEKNETKWYPIEDLIKANDVDEEIEKFALDIL